MLLTHNNEHLEILDRTRELTRDEGHKLGDDCHVLSTAGAIDRDEVEARELSRPLKVVSWADETDIAEQNGSLGYAEGGQNGVPKSSPFPVSRSLGHAEGGQTLTAGARTSRNVFRLPSANARS